MAHKNSISNFQNHKTTSVGEKYLGFYTMLVSHNFDLDNFIFPLNHLSFLV